MAFELIDVTATGLFSGTLFGQDAKKSVAEKDIFSSGSLNSLLTDSNIGIPESIENLFTKVSPVGAKNLINDPDIQQISQSTGKSMDQILADGIEQCPVEVTSYGDVFDDNTLSFGDANSLMDRLAGALTRTQFNSIEQGDLKKVLNLTKNITIANDENGDLECKINTDKQKNGSLGKKGKDENALAGFLGAMVSKLAGNGCLDAVLPLISEYSDELGISDSVMASAKKVLSKDMANDGRLDHTVDLIGNLGLDAFKDPEKKAMAKAMAKNYHRPEYIKPEELAGEAGKLKQFMDDMDPNWLNKTKGTHSVTDLETIANSSDDFKDVMSNDFSFAALVAATKSAFV